MPTSILFVLNRLAGGGAETQVMRLSVAFAKRGWGVTIVSLLPDVIETPELDLAGVAKVNLSARRGFRAGLALPRLVRVIREAQPDVVVTMMIPADPITRIACGMVGVPVVSSIRNSFVGGEFVNRLLRWTDGLAAVITANASPTKTDLGPRITRASDRMVLIPNLLDYRAYLSLEGDRDAARKELGLDSNCFAWLAVGSQRPQKNYALLLEAFAQLPSDSMLLIAGAPYQQDDLSKQSQALRIEHRVSFLGRRSDIPRLLSACDAFVQASSYEGTPNSVLEAMAAARPVVATEVGGVPDTISHGRTGWLVAPGDVDALEKQMREVMSFTQEERSRIGYRARKHIASTHSPDVVIPQWEAVMAMATGKSRCRSNH